MSTRQIAKEVEVSVSWTHSILKKANLPTNPPRKKKITYICQKCKYNYRNPLFTCHYCQVKFRRSRSKVTAAIKNGCKHIYCEQKCTYRAKRDNNADL